MSLATIDTMPELMKVQEVAEILRVHRTTVCTMIEGGKLKAKKIGNRWLIPKSELERLLTE